jgi:hypothetical protein
MASHELTVERVRLPLPFKLINLAGETLRHLKVPIAPLSEESLLAAARKQTRLSDFGDPCFLVGLPVLLDDLERHGNLSWFGRHVFVRMQLLRILANRLRIEDDLKRHPEILDVPIERPLFIVGLPRTGTTLLHNLLAQIPGVRAPLLWELLSPSPPPSPEGRETDSRVVSVHRQMRFQRYVMPELIAAHPMSAQAPDECYHLLELTFASISLSLLAASAPRYNAWLLAKDRVPDYQYFRRLLQILKWRFPGDTLIMKSPVHLQALGALCAVLPDANVIQTHRDPRKVMGSICSLIGMMQNVTCRQVDLARVGHENLSIWGDSMDRALRARATLAPERFFDVHYLELVRDPIGMVRRIYGHFGYPLPPLAESRMQRWLSEHPQNKHGVHKYMVQHFALSPEAIDRTFAGYSQHFGISHE